MALFIETSALVKGYITERRGSDVMTAVLSEPAFHGALFVSEVVALEAFACFARKLRERSIDDLGFHAAWTELRQDLDGRLGIVEHRPELVDNAIAAVYTHRDRSVGGVDLLHVMSATHLASALAENQLPVIFAAADRTLREVAEARGFITFDPESGSVAGLYARMQPGLDLR